MRLRVDPCILDRGWEWIELEDLIGNIRGLGAFHGCTELIGRRCSASFFWPLVAELTGLRGKCIILGRSGYYCLLRMELD